MTREEVITSRRGIIGAAAAAIVLSLGVVAGPAQASDRLAELVALNPGMTKAGVEQLVEQVAAETGSTPAVVTDEMLTEAREPATAASGSTRGRGGNTQADPNSSGGGTTMLGYA